MEYIFFFLEFILLAIGAVSTYTYIEIKEEHDHSENAKQISLVNIILPFGVFLITMFLYFYKTISLDRLVTLVLFSCIISAFISFAVYYLLWKENDEHNENINQTLREINEVTYIFSIFLVIFIIGILIGYDSTSAKAVEIKKQVVKPINLVRLNTDKPHTPVPVPAPVPAHAHAPAHIHHHPHMHTDNSSQLMDDFIGKDPTIQKVIIL